MAERDVKKVGLATIQMYTRQRPHDRNNKNLYGEEAILYETPIMKQILEWSGISPLEAIDIARETDGFRNDEVIQALERIIQESKSD